MNLKKSLVGCLVLVVSSKSRREPKYTCFLMGLEPHTDGHVKQDFEITDRYESVSLGPRCVLAPNTRFLITDVIFSKNRTNKTYIRVCILTDDTAYKINNLGETISNIEKFAYVDIDFEHYAEVDCQVVAEPTRPWE